MVRTKFLDRACKLKRHAGFIYTTPEYDSRREPLRFMFVFYFRVACCYDLPSDEKIGQSFPKSFPPMLRMCRDFVSVSPLRVRGESLNPGRLKNSPAISVRHRRTEAFVAELHSDSRTRRGEHHDQRKWTLPFLTTRPIVFQDIDGDVGGAYARVSLHPAGPHCEIAHPLNVESRRGRCRRRKDAEHRGSARSCQWHMGLGHTLCSACKSIHLQKETRHTTVRERDSERGRERKRKKEHERERDREKEIYTQYVLM